MSNNRTSIDPCDGPVSVGGPLAPLVIEASIWSADSDRIAEELQRIEPFADMVHIDVGDGILAPQLFTPNVLAAVPASLGSHVHIMAATSFPLVETWVRTGADLVTVQIETSDLDRALDLIASCGKQAGVALTLDTDPTAATPFANAVDVVVMIGTPLGTKGTAIDPAAPDRIAAVAETATQSRPPIRVIADGGIRFSSVPELAAAGADAVVAGSILFDSPDTAAAADWMRGRGIGPIPNERDR